MLTASRWITDSERLPEITSEMRAKAPLELAPDIEEGLRRAMYIVLIALLPSAAWYLRKDYEFELFKHFPDLPIILEQKECLLEFSSPSIPVEKPSSHRMNTRGFDRMYGFSDGSDLVLQLQCHLRHFAPFTPEQGPKRASKDLGFLFKRQSARIHHVTQPSLPTRGKDHWDQDLCLQEQVLSLSLMIYRESGTFRVIVLGDKGISVEIPDDKTHDVYTRIGIYPWSSGKRAGYAHFLVALFLLLESWHLCWNSTLDAIDNVVSFKVSMLFE